MLDITNIRNIINNFTLTDVLNYFIKVIYLKIFIYVNKQKKLNIKISLILNSMYIFIIFIYYFIDW